MCECVSLASETALRSVQFESKYPTFRLPPFLSSERERVNERERERKRETERKRLVELLCLFAFLLQML